MKLFFVAIALALCVSNAAEQEADQFILASYTAPKPDADAEPVVVDDAPVLAKEVLKKEAEHEKPTEAPVLAKEEAPVVEDAPVPVKAKHEKPTVNLKTEKKLSGKSAGKSKKQSAGKKINKLSAKVKGKKAGSQEVKDTIKKSVIQQAVDFAMKAKTEVAEQAQVQYGACHSCYQGASGDCMDRDGVCWSSSNDQCPPNTNKCFANGEVVPFPSLNPVSSRSQWTPPVDDVVAVKTSKYGKCNDCGQSTEGECMSPTGVCFGVVLDVYGLSDPQCPPATVRCLADGSHAAFPSDTPVMVHKPIKLNKVEEKKVEEDSIHGTCGECPAGTSGLCKDRAGLCWDLELFNDGLAGTCPPNTRRCLKDGSIVPFPSNAPVLVAKASPDAVSLKEKSKYGLCGNCLQNGAGSCKDRNHVCYDMDVTVTGLCPPNTKRCLADGTIEEAFPSEAPKVEFKRQKKKTPYTPELDAQFQASAPGTKLAKAFKCGACAGSSSTGVNKVCQDSDHVCYTLDRLTMTCPQNTKDCSDHLGVHWDLL